MKFRGPAPTEYRPSLIHQGKRREPLPRKPKAFHSVRSKKTGLLIQKPTLEEARAERDRLDGLEPTRKPTMLPVSPTLEKIIAERERASEPEHKP